MKGGGDAAPARGARLRADVLSGLTVALVGLPQCLAYAMLSGVPPAYGLSTAAVAGFVAPLVGRSPHIITGPTNTTGLLILAAMAPWLASNGLVGESGLAPLATLTFLAGAVRILATLVRADQLLRFFPESVLVGFTAGAGTLIGVNQLDEALGLAPLGGGNLFDELSGIVAALRGGSFPAWPAVTLSALTAAAIFFGKRWRPRWPVALAAVVLATVAAYLLGLDAGAGLPVVSDRAIVPRGWPPVALPTVDLGVIREMLLPAAAIALLGTLELTVSVKASAEPTDMKREIRAQGVANLVGSFAGTFPASASLTRSALLRLGGASTRRAAMIAAVAVVPILFFGADLVASIPQASLAGVLLVTAAGMLDRRRLRRLWDTSPESRLLLVTTFLATLVLPLEWAILGGAGLGIAIHLRNTSDPRVHLLRPDGDGLVPVSEEDKPPVVVVVVSGDLYYAAVPAFVEQVRRLIPASARVVVFDLSHAHQLRFSAMRALEQLREELGSQGVELRLAGVSKEFAQVLESARSDLPRSPADPVPGASVARCLREHCADADEPPA